MTFDMNTNGQYWSGEATAPLSGNQNSSYGGGVGGDDFLNLKAETLEMFNSQQYSLGQHQLGQQVPMSRAQNRHDQGQNDHTALQQSQLLGHQHHQQHLHSQQPLSYDDLNSGNISNAQTAAYGEGVYASGSNNSSPINNFNGSAPVHSPDSSSVSTAADEQLKKDAQATTLAAKRSKSKKISSDDQDLLIMSKDDSELTEAELQIKRKAQNRAAQRAFRERKETKLKELETKLLQSQEERQKLTDQLDLIRRQNISISTENEILRNNNSKFGDSHSSNSNGVTPVLAQRFYFPKSEDEFIDRMVGGTIHRVQPAYSHKVFAAQEDPDHKLLGIGALWDYLHLRAEELGLEEGSMDVTQIMAKLRGNEICQGYGPAYSLDLVNKFISESCGVN